MDTKTFKGRLTQLLSDIRSRSERNRERVEHLGMSTGWVDDRARYLDTARQEEERISVIDVLLDEMDRIELREESFEYLKVNLPVAPYGKITDLEE